MHGTQSACNCLEISSDMRRFPIFSELSEMILSCTEDVVLLVCQLMLQLLSEKVEKRPLGVEELAAAASVASTTEPFRPVQSDIEQRARQSAAAEDNHAATVRAAKQAQRERNAAALERSMTADTASYLSRDGTTRFAAASTPGDGRHPSPRKKERRNWSPGRRDKFKAPPSPMQPNKAAPSGDLPTASALLQRTNGATGTGTSGQLPRDGSDGSDGWEEVREVALSVHPWVNTFGSDNPVSYQIQRYTFQKTVFGLFRKICVAEVVGSTQMP